MATAPIAPHRMDIAGPCLSCSPPSKTPSLHDSARGSPPPEHDLSGDNFQRLVDDINRILGPSNGIDSADVDVEELKSAMQDYASSEDGWQRYAFADSSRAYTRNLVDAGNGKCNLVSKPTITIPDLDHGLTQYHLAHPRLDPRKRQPDPRSRQRALHHESAQRLTARDVVLLAL